MVMVYALEAVALLVLLWVFRAVWVERTEYAYLQPMIPATLFLAMGRVLQLGSRLPARESVGGPESLQANLGSAGDTLEMLGLVLLATSVLLTLRRQSANEQRIRALEQLLPVCAVCKRYRTPDNTWLPMTVFIGSQKAPEFAHAVCPECKKALGGELVEETPKRSPN
jgi:hypothetical protein